MKPRWIIALALIAGVILFIVIFAAMAASSYNRVVGLSQKVNSAWAQVQNVYQRRADLVPNLVATVSGAASFEKTTLTEITQARASVGKVVIDKNNAPADAAKLAQFDQAQSQLSSALSRLLVVVERYPELKANSNFLELQAQLEGTENRISVERRNFNEAVLAYNTAIKSVPTVFYAGFFGFLEKPYFAAAPGAENAPKVNFNFDAKPQPAQ